jgi:hypothetical protein
VSEGFETAGELLFAGKTAMSFDALVQPGSVEVRKLDIQDERSRVRMSMQWRQDVVAGSFTGTLAGISLERIVRAAQLPETRATGELTYRIPLRQPRDFRANGELRVNRLTPPGWASPLLHLTVQNAAIKAADRSLHLVTSISVHDTNFDISGTVRGTDQRYALDLDVKSDAVEVERLLAAHEREGRQGPEERRTSWDFPVEGKVRLAIQSLRHSHYHIQPLLAAMDIAPDHIDFTVREARMCGIGMTGGGRAHHGTVSIDVVLRARDIDPDLTLRCLTREGVAITGRLQADARLTGTGPYRDLPQRLQGPFHLVARHGRVDRMAALADILNLVNASELLRGKKLGLSSSGFAYDSLEVKGRVDRGVTHFDEIVLDAQPFDMVARGSVDWLEDSIDMNVAVAPLQAVNTLLKWVPFLGYVLGGGVYAVPAGVRGKLSDPQIVPVSPTAVAGELLGVLGRTLKVPFNLREALVPPALESEPGSSPVPRAP